MGLRYRKLLAGTIFTVSLAFAGITNTPNALAANDKSMGHLAEAQEFLKDGKVNAAIIELKNAIKADSTNAAARVQLGMIYLRSGDAAAAEKELSAGLAAGADRKAVLQPLGQALLRLDRADELLEFIDPSAEEESIRPLLHVLRADAYISQNDQEKAEQELETALALNDQIPEPHMGKAALAQRANDLVQAQKSLETAFALDQDNFDVLFRLGDILRIRSQHEAAIEYFDRALEDRPNASEVLISRALAKLGVNEYADAESDAQAVLERNPNSDLAKYVQAVVLTQRGEAQPALDILVTAPSLENFPAALYLIANLNYSTEQYESAREYIKRYNQFSENDANGSFLEALINLAQSETADAIVILEDLIEQFPDNYKITAVLAGAYLNSGDFEKAGIYFDKATTLDPENDQLKLRLAQSQLVGGAAGDAANILEQFVEKNPDEDGAFGLLIISYVRSGNYDKARAAVEELKKKIPESGLPYNFEAAVELSQSNMDAARGALESAIEVQPDFNPARLNLARISRSLGDADEARIQYEAILESDAKQIDALLGLAELSSQEDDLDKAMDYVERAESGNPESARPGINRAQLLLRQDETEKAKLLISNLRDTFPEDKTVLETQASIFESEGDLLGAISSMERLAQLTPNSIDYAFQIGRLHLNLRNFPEASNAFDRAIALNPNNGTTRTARLNVEYEAYGFDRSKELAQKMKAELGDAAIGDILVGDVFFRENQNAEALDYYRDAYAKGPNQAVLLQLYATHSRLGEFDVAKELLQAWLSDNDEDVRVRSALGDLFIRTKDYDRAIVESEKIIEANPDNAAVLNNLAWLYGQKGELDKAIDYAEKSYEAQPVAPIADTLGWLLFQKGDLDRATELLRSAAEDLPENNEVNYHLAVALNQSGESEKAKQLLKKVLDSGVEFDDLQAAKNLYKSLIE